MLKTGPVGPVDGPGVVMDGLGCRGGEGEGWSAAAASAGAPRAAAAATTPTTPSLMSLDTSDDGRSIQRSSSKPPTRTSPTPRGGTFGAEWAGLFARPTVHRGEP